MVWEDRGWVAERVGFEPTIPCEIPLFESGAFNHSATSPGRRHRMPHTQRPGTGPGSAYCIGEKDAGRSIFVSCLIMNSDVGGGHSSSLEDSARIRSRSSKLL